MIDIGDVKTERTPIQPLPGESRADFIVRLEVYERRTEASRG